MKEKRERERERDWSKGKDNYISRGRSKWITCCLIRRNLIYNWIWSDVSTYSGEMVLYVHQAKLRIWKLSPEHTWIFALAAKLLQSCSTLCDPTDGSPPGSPVPGILQARTLKWAAISFSNAWKWKVKVKSLSRVRLLGTPWTAAHQAPLSMGFSRREYWSGLSLPSPFT